MRSFVLRTPEHVQSLWAYIDRQWQGADPPFEVRVAPLKSTRTNEQNARMWAMLEDVALQVVWHGQRLTAEDWKNIFTASLKAQRVVPGLDGSSFVVIGARTSAMTISQMSELIDFMHAFGVERGVRFGDEPATISPTEKA